MKSPATPVAYPMMPRIKKTMPPIQVTFARVSERPCSRNLLWANNPRPIAPGEQQNQQTMPMMASTVGVLLWGACALP